VTTEWQAGTFDCAPRRPSCRIVKGKDNSKITIKLTASRESVGALLDDGHRSTKPVVVQKCFFLPILFALRFLREVGAICQVTSVHMPRIIGMYSKRASAGNKNTWPSFGRQPIGLSLKCFENVILLEVESAHLGPR
jgi:hypothetical protein